MLVGEVFIHRKHCKVQNLSRNIFYIFLSCQVDQIAVFAGLIVAPGPYIWHTWSISDKLDEDYLVTYRVEVG